MFGGRSRRWEAGLVLTGSVALTCLVVSLLTFTVQKKKKHPSAQRWGEDCNTQYELFYFFFRHSFKSILYESLSVSLFMVHIELSSLFAPPPREVHCISFVFCISSAAFPSFILYFCYFLCTHPQHVVFFSSSFSEQ